MIEMGAVTYEGVGPTGQPTAGKGMQIPKACAAEGVECLLLGHAFEHLSAPFA
ncbi:MAG: hypothetical protein ACKVUT_01865 [Gaiella sp.]